MAARVSPAPTPRRLLRAEYDRMGELGFFRGERTELIRGTVLSTPAIGALHANIVRTLTELLLPRLLGRARVSTQLPFIAVDESQPEPDVAVIPPGDYSARHPDRAHLIIEVAGSSLTYDRETKAPLYAASGVPEYWIVDVAGRGVDVYSEPRAGAYARALRVTSPDARLVVAAFPDVVIRVADVFSA